MACKIEPYDEILADMLNQRSLIRNVITPNQFSTVNGNTFHKTDFDNYRDHINYEMMGES